MSQSAEEPHQIIEGHNLDPYRLVNLLQTVYGKSVHGENNFRVEVRNFVYCAGIPSEVLTISTLQLRLNRYKIYVSDDVSDRQVLSDVREK